MTYLETNSRQKWLKSQDTLETITINFQCHSSKENVRRAVFCVQRLYQHVQIKAIETTATHPSLQLISIKLEMQTKVEHLQCKKCKRNTNYNVGINSAVYQFMWIILSATATET